MRTIAEMTGPVALAAEHHALVCDFLLVFSRFEAALKCARYARQEGVRLFVEWRRFVRENQPAAADNNPLPVNDLRVLIEHPPARQQIIRERFEFPAEAPGREPVDSEWLLEMVYRVRNNLFHGGKWPVQPERDAELLRACLVALTYYVDLSTEVTQAYFGE